MTDVDNCPLCPPQSKDDHEKQVLDVAKDFANCDRVVNMPPQIEPATPRVQFYSFEQAVEDKLDTAAAFREGYASGVEFERKRAYKAKLQRSLVKPTRWQLFKFAIQQRFDRSTHKWGT